MTANETSIPHMLGALAIIEFFFLIPWFFAIGWWAEYGPNPLLAVTVILGPAGIIWAFATDHVTRRTIVAAWRREL